MTTYQLVDIDLATTAEPQDPYAPFISEPKPTEKHEITPPPEDDATVALIAAALLAGLTAVALLALLVKILKPWGITARALGPILKLTLRGTKTRPNAVLGSRGARTEGIVLEVRDNESFFRAAYIANAAKRVQVHLDEVPVEPGEVPEPEDVQKALDEALEAERRYYEQHEKARKERQKTAAQVQTAADVFGPLLGWYLNPLLNNEAECIAANGNNFYAVKGTVLGLPGSVHSGCGCYAGPPHDGGRMVNDAVKGVVAYKRNHKPTFKMKRTR